MSGVNPLLASRIRAPKLLNRVVNSAEETLSNFKDGQILSWSGFTSVGYPKLIPQALSAKMEKEMATSGAKTSPMSFTLYTGASTCPHLEDKWAKLGMIRRRAPFQSGKNVNSSLNTQNMEFFDQHLSKFCQQLMQGAYIRPRENPCVQVIKRKGAVERTDGRIDLAIVEATAINEDGSIVPSVAVGATPELLHLADKVLIELNTGMQDMSGLHDIPKQIFDLPPNRAPYMIRRAGDRIGAPGMPLDMNKVVGIVETKTLDDTPGSDPADDAARGIAGHLMNFFQYEVAAGRLPPSLLPIQSGIGNVANAVVSCLGDSPFKGMMAWSEVIQDSWLPHFLAGKVDFGSTTSIRFSKDALNLFFENWDFFKSRMVLRPQSVSNLPEIINRMGVIAMNTPVEVDIYGHANSTHVSGGRMLNGIGGSSDFLHNAGLCIMHTPSVRPSKNDPFGVSTIVPFATHVDHTEHDIDVVVTEQGLADIRGLAPIERAELIIQKCAHPVYRPILMDYLNEAKARGQAIKSCHEPHLLDSAFKMHQYAITHGTMRVPNWSK